MMSLCSIHTLTQEIISLFPLSSASKCKCWQNATDWKSSTVFFSLIPTELKLALENPLHNIQLMCLGADLESTPVRWERSLNPKYFGIIEDLWLALMDFELSLCPGWDCQRESVTTAKLCCGILWKRLHNPRNGTGTVALYHVFFSPGKAWWVRGKMGSWSIHLWNKYSSLVQRRKIRFSWHGTGDLMSSQGASVVGSGQVKIKHRMHQIKGHLLEQAQSLCTWLHSGIN